MGKQEKKTGKNQGKFTLDWARGADPRPKLSFLSSKECLQNQLKAPVYTPEDKEKSRQKKLLQIDAKSNFDDAKKYFFRTSKLFRFF